MSLQAQDPELRGLGPEPRSGGTSLSARARGVGLGPDRPAHFASCSHSPSSDPRQRSSSTGLDAGTGSRDDLVEPRTAVKEPVRDSNRPNRSEGTRARPDADYKDQPAVARPAEAPRRRPAAAATCLTDDGNRDPRADVAEQDRHDTSFRLRSRVPFHGPNLPPNDWRLDDWPLLVAPHPSSRLFARTASARRPSDGRPLLQARGPPHLRVDGHGMAG